MKNLTAKQIEQFEAFHQAHLIMCGGDLKKKYAKENIENVVFDEKENCFKVYYKCGDWFHYAEDCGWY